jgi:subtilisin family serine protease
MRYRSVVRVTLLGVLALCTSVGTAAGPGRAKGRPAPPNAVPGELIVGFAPGVREDQRDHALAAVGAHDERSFGAIRARLVRVAPDGAVAARKRLLADPQVRYAEPNYVVSADGPNDPALAQLWGLDNVGQDVNGTAGTPDADIDAPEAWAVTTGSAGSVVAVVDTGVDFTHPDLAAQEWTNPGEIAGNGIDDDGNGYVDDVHGWDFVNHDNDPTDDYGHGTHVAGTIGAVGDNGIGVVGVNWNVRIMSLKFLGADGSGYTSDAVTAVLYACANGAQVLNNSWGGGGYSQALLDAINECDRRGSLFVAAAGNNGDDTDLYPHYPSSYDALNVVSVAATDSSDGLAYFSNQGARTVDLGAPGVAVYSTLPGGGYGFKSGTSMATPHVAGSAALLRAAFPGASALGLKALLLSTVDPLGSLAGITVSGGRLNVGRAAVCARRATAWIDAPAPGFVASTGEAVPIRVVGASCSDPAGATVSVTANGEPVTLTARGDGLYTGSLTAGAAGPIRLEATATAGAATDVRVVTGSSVANYALGDDTFDWVDATTAGTWTALTGDDDGLTVDLPFAFPLYDQTYSSVTISTNGYLVFGGDTPYGFSNEPIPSVNPPNGIVAPLWDDLVVRSTSSVWTAVVGTAPNRRFVVEWADVASYSVGGAATFEAVLEETTGDVVFQYRDTVFGTAGWDYGGSATIGIESPSGAFGRQFSYGTASLQLYENAVAIRFARGGLPAAVETVIDSGPTGAVATPAAAFAFHATVAGSTFTCSLDEAAATPCTSPQGYSGVADGTHTFRVQAAGDPTPATLTWTVDTTAPETTIDSGPDASTTLHDATLAFHASEPATFACSLDGAAFTTCSSPASYSALGGGAHSFGVRATDAVGNVDATPATWSWNVDLLANGSFEGLLDDWGSLNARLSLVSGGADGWYAARVSYTSGSGNFSIYTVPRPVNATVAGVTYTAGGSGRSVSNLRTICLRLREYSPAGAVLRSAESCVNPYSYWKQFAPVRLTAAGGGSLELDAYSAKKGNSGSFDVDAVTLATG